VLSANGGLQRCRTLALNTLVRHKSLDHSCLPAGSIRSSPPPYRQCGTSSDTWGRRSRRQLLVVSHFEILKTPPVVKTLELCYSLSHAWVRPIRSCFSKPLASLRELFTKRELHICNAALRLLLQDFCNFANGVFSNRHVLERVTTFREATLNRLDPFFPLLQRIALCRELILTPAPVRRL